MGYIICKIKERIIMFPNSKGNNGGGGIVKGLVLIDGDDVSGGMAKSSMSSGGNKFGGGMAKASVSRGDDVSVVDIEQIGIGARGGGSCRTSADDDADKDSGFCSRKLCR
jgi:hypothetical protein